MKLKDLLVNMMAYINCFKTLQCVGNGQLGIGNCGYTVFKQALTEVGIVVPAFLHKY